MTEPFFSIVCPVYSPPLEALRTTIASVCDQSDAGWELLLVDDLSPDPAVLDLLESAAAGDARIRIIRRESNGGIVVASNDAVAEARGEFLALLDHDDLLEPDALERFREAICTTPTADYLYSDEDKVDLEGRHYDRFDKPDWSPERLRGQMYTAHLSVLRTSLVRDVGGFTVGSDGSQDHDLVLKVTERARTVVHIREVLYHWRAVPGSTAAAIGNKDYAWEAGRRAVDDHLHRLGLAADAQLGPVPGTYRVVREPDLVSTISVIIPTRGSRGTVFGSDRVFVVEAVRSLLAGTRHPNVEIVVVFDPPTPAAVLEELRAIAGDRLILVPFDGPFNFSKKCNEGFLASSGDIVLFVNDDVEVISDEVVGDLAAPLAEPDVGMTGAMLLFEDDSIQHAGHLYHQGVFTHSYFREPQDHYGAFSSLLINREVSGLTAACVALRREVFLDAGGFSEILSGNFNDVDLSKKLGLLGYRMLWLTGVRLHHFESQSRDPLVHSWEERSVLERWGGPARDPYLA